MYPHVVHYLKAWCCIQPAIPATIRSLKNKVETLEQLFHDLKTTDEGELHRFRVEIRIEGFVRFSDAYEVAKQVIPGIQLSRCSVHQADQPEQQLTGSNSRCVKVS